MGISINLLSMSKEQHSEQEIQEELHEHYNDIEDFICGVAEDRFHLVINGTAGMGKTEFTNDVLKQYRPNNKFGKTPIKKPIRLSGTASGIKMFVELQKAKEQGQITIVDDTDKLLEDVECLDLLKGCLDSQIDEETGLRKEVAWSKYSNAIKQQDVKEKFIYNGKLIIITNKRIQNIQDDNPTMSRLRLDPVMSRCQYLKAGLPNNEFKMIAIKMFFNGYRKERRYQLRCFKTHNIPEDAQLKIINFMDKHKDRFTELSFRTVDKMCTLYNHRPDRWDRLAMQSLFSQY